MGRTRKRSSTEWMIKALAKADRTDVSLPPEFLCGLRGALEAGLSCEEITALLVLFTGVYEAGERMTGSELVERAKHLAVSMKGDICLRADERAQRRKNREALLAKRRRKRGTVGGGI